MLNIQCSIINVQFFNNVSTKVTKLQLTGEYLQAVYHCFVNPAVQSVDLLKKLSR